MYQQPMYQQPPTYQQQFQPIETDEEKFQRIMKKHEIGTFYSGKLKQVAGFEIVIIGDDSGSMNTVVTGGKLGMTRWEEFKEMVRILVDIAGLMDPNGLDLYFLNREPVFNVKDSNQIAAAFHEPPSGGTPISAVLRQVLKDKKQKAKEQKLLIIIATDGLATNDNGDVDMDTLEKILKNERIPKDRIYNTFLMCTDDEGVLKIYNRWDKKIHHVDVVDDYNSEKKEIKRVKGSHYVFSFGDYVVKSIIGSVDSTIDKQDEKSRCIIL